MAVQQGRSNSGQSVNPSLNTLLQRADNGCTPAAGIQNTNCSAYAANSWWLPFAYTHNTTCACQTTQNVPTASCVRSRGIHQVFRFVSQNTGKMVRSKGGVVIYTDRLKKLQREK